MRNRFAFIILAIAFFSCKPDFKKGLKGIEYLILSEGKGANLKHGNFMQIHVCQFLRHEGKDSLMSDTRENHMPYIEFFDSTGVPPEYFNILSQLKKGDSLVMRMPADSMFSTAPGAMPPFVKKGDYFVTTVRLQNIYTNANDAQNARTKLLLKKQEADSIESLAMLRQDEKVLKDYFAKNKITGTQKGMLGTYVQILQPGAGPMIDTSVVVVVNYTGRTMDGNMFDSNTDSSKGHVEPFKVNMTNDPSLGGGVIKGWYDGLKLLNKGAKAKFYIPSPLAYGKMQMGNEIKENSILVFDIEVLDVLTRDQAKAQKASENIKIEGIERNLRKLNNLPSSQKK
jgi:FKBP-type peptidyl-prolyl cis-trans isomerase FkpA